MDESGYQIEGDGLNTRFGVGSSQRDYLIALGSSKPSQKLMQNRKTIKLGVTK